MTTNIKFPKRRADGSFCIEISIPLSTSVDAEKLRQQVQNWADRWVETNAIWKRNWLSENDELRYDEEFKGPPTAIVSAPNELGIRLECKPSAKWWKDWMVYRLLTDLRRVFTEAATPGHVHN